MDAWYKRIWNWFGSDAVVPDDGEQSGVPAQLLVGGALKTHANELDCDQCFEQLDRFTELRMAGGDAADIMPLVQDHLDRCPDCREEYEALLLALQANA